QLGFPAAARGRYGFWILYVDSVLQAVPSQGSIHRAGIDMNEIERFGHELRVGALAAGARAIDGDDDRLLHSANNSSKPSLRLVVPSRMAAPSPSGGAAASF